MNDVYRQRQLQELEDDYSAGKISYDVYRASLARLGVASTPTASTKRQKRSSKKPFVVGIAVALTAVGIAAVVAHETGAVQIGKTTVAPADSSRAESPSDGQDVPDEEAHLLDEGGTDDGAGAPAGMSAFDLGVMYGRDLAADGVTSGSSHCRYDAEVRYGPGSVDAGQFFRGCMFGVG